MTLGFAAQKTRLLQRLTAPHAANTGHSSKDSVDIGIRSLVDEINKIDTLATTSSCAGRVVVYLEGSGSSSSPSHLDDDMGISGLAIATEGFHDQSLFVSHDPLPLSGKRPVAPMLGLSDHTNLGVPSSIEGVRWVRCKFEPLVRYLLFYAVLLFPVSSRFSQGQSSISPELIDRPDAASVMLITRERTQSEHSSISIWIHRKRHLKHIN